MLLDRLALPNRLTPYETARQNLIQECTTLNPLITKDVLERIAAVSASFSAAKANLKSTTTAPFDPETTKEDLQKISGTLILAKALKEQLTSEIAFQEGLLELEHLPPEIDDKTYMNSLKNNVKLLKKEEEGVIEKIETIEDRITSLVRQIEQYKQKAAALTQYKLTTTLQKGASLIARPFTSSSLGSEYNPTEEILAALLETAQDDHKESDPSSSPASSTCSSSASSTSASPSSSPTPWKKKAAAPSDPGAVLTGKPKKKD